MSGMPLSRRPVLVGVAFAMLMLAQHARAESNSNSWPKDKPITWIVGFAPGGTADSLTRYAASKLEQKIGQRVIVENRPGAAGLLSLQMTAKAKPDGYTLVYVTGPTVYNQAAPEFGKDLRPIALLGLGPLVLVAPSSAKPVTMQELLQAIRQDPKAWSYATSGTGGTQHLAGELLNSMAGVSMTQVPYKGGSQAVIDVVGAQVPLALLGPTAVMPYIKSGKLKAYGVTSRSRMPQLPQVPTFQEAGLNNYEALSWSAVAAPSGVQDKIATRLNALLGEIMTSEEGEKTLHILGMEPGKGTADEVSDFFKADDKKWQALAHDLNLFADEKK